MGAFAGPDVSESGLVLALDGANYKSFKGKDTYNYTRNSRDFSGSSYASLDEWTSNPSVLSKTYISSIATPVGNGATLIQESGSNGYHHLSRWGGSGESGAHSLSCYVFPLTSDITNFVIGMLGDGSNQISFNLNTREITYGSGISNTNAFITPVVGFDGWYRVGANIEGRYGGWVGCIGYTTSATYTGTSGNKKCYITGIQYELKTKPTMFTEAQTTRGSTVATGGGWKDLIGSNNGELVNGVSENSGNLGSLDFDGTDDYVTTTLGTYTPYCIDIWFKNDDDITSATMQGNYQQLLGVGTYPGGISLGAWTSGAVDETFSFFSAGWSGNGLTYIRDTASSGIHNLVVNWNGSSFDFWLDGTKRTAYASIHGHRILETVTGFQVGSAYNNANSYEFDGSVYSVKVYTSQLSDAQVQQNFNAIRSRFGI